MGVKEDGYCHLRKTTKKLQKRWNIFLWSFYCSFEMDDTTVKKGWGWDMASVKKTNYKKEGSR